MKEKLKQEHLNWWRQNGDNERFIADWYSFLDRHQVGLCDGKTVAEVAVGAVGGILNNCAIRPAKRIYIDVIMSDLKALNLVKWKVGEYVDAPFEKLPFDDQSIDILLGYNSLDHGTNWKKGLKECLRVAKIVYLNFDVRADTPHIKEVKDRFHPQIISFKQVKAFAEKRGCIVTAIMGRKGRICVEIHRERRDAFIV